MAHAPVQQHGKLTQVFSDVWLVTGSMRAGAGVTFTRNMTVVRDGQRLVLVNSVRLDSATEAELERLGKVTDVVRLGGFHGLDDPYMKERFGATMWAPANIRKPYVEYRTLEPGACPISDATPFLFSAAREADAALILARDGGILISCDSFQNWTTYDGCSLLARVVMRVMGFGPAVIGKPWAKRMGPGVRADFARLREQPFVHALSGHGTPIRDDAKALLDQAIAVRFGAR